MRKDAPGSRNLLLLLVFVGSSLLGLYSLLAVRAWLWTPHRVVKPATRGYVPSTVYISSSDFEPEVLRGRRLYQDLRCGVCHGPAGEGGVKNPNADPKKVVPNLFDLAEAYTVADLTDKIKKGFQPEKLEEEGPKPPLHMPGFDELVSAREFGDLNSYLLTLKAPPGFKSDEDDDEEEEDEEDEDDEEDEEEDEDELDEAEG